MPITITAFDVCWTEDTDADTSYLEQDDFEARLSEYRTGAFHFLGCQARAQVTVNGVSQRVYSGGVWGIESDSDTAYLNDIQAEQVAELVEILREFGISEEDIARVRSGK